MAAKANMLKLLQEIRGFEHMARRRPLPPLPGLVLTQMRASVTEGRLRQRKLAIAIHPEAQLELARQVKIVHLNAATAAPAHHPVP
jgi:hypothetical protein